MTHDLAARAQEAIERAAQHLYEHRTGNTWNPHAITAAERTHVVAGEPDYQPRLNRAIEEA